MGRTAYGTAATYRIFPNMNYEIFFNFGDHCVNTSVGKALRPLRTATVFGPKTSCYQHRVGTYTDWFLVQLTPLGARALLGCPFAALINADANLEEMLPDSNKLVDELLKAGDFSARLQIFEHWAWNRLRHVDTGGRARALSALHGKMRALPFGAVDHFARKLDLGQRQFRNILRDEIGLAPKELLGLFRIEQAWTTLYLTGSIGEASALYADHAHFTREFNRFTGMTPIGYKRLKFSGDTILNGFNEALQT